MGNKKGIRNGMLRIPSTLLAGALFFTANVCLLAFCLSARSDDLGTSATFHSAQDILECVLRNQPDIQRSNADIAITKASEITARQIPNPGLNSRNLIATAGGVTNRVYELNIAQPIELGGKRESRIAKSLADQELSWSAAQEVREGVVIQTVLTLHRLRQLRLEVGELDETLAIYERIREAFKNLQILSPEQRVSLSVLRTTTQANQLQKIALMDEENRLRAFLEKATGRSIEITPEVLPRPITHWPDYSPKAAGALLGGAKMKKALAELSDASAAYRLAKSQAWPDVDLGPSIEPNTMGERTTTSFGFNLAVPLPMYHQNQGQVQAALSAQNRAKLNLDLTKGELAVEFASLVARYDQNLKAVEKGQLVRSLEEKREETSLESLFRDGLIPSSLMIEARRQVFEFLQGLNAAELRTIEALWRLYALEGRIFDKKI